MLGDPIAVIAELVGETGKVEGVAERVGPSGVFRNRGLIENADSKRGGFWHGGFASMVIEACGAGKLKNLTAGERRGTRI
jgi:hypothetical protein